MLPSPSKATVDPDAWLASVGRVFARFDRQDSGNVSFGVEAGGRRYFVKTAGPPTALGLPLAHADRRRSSPMRSGWRSAWRIRR